jgi:small-conductance mechanosensitive channel
MDMDQAETDQTSNQSGGWKKAKAIIYGLAIASIAIIALCALGLAAAALVDAPQGIRLSISFCLGGASIFLFFLLSVAFFCDIFGVFFKIEKFKPFRLLGRLFLCLLGLLPLGSVWAVLRIIRGFQA